MSRSGNKICIRNTTFAVPSTRATASIHAKEGDSTECKICGAPARYSYFGAIVCSSCKMFFKRNAESRQDTLKCISNNQCHVDLSSRRICGHCRLKKCLESGMRVEMIRPRRFRQNERRVWQPATTVREQEETNNQGRHVSSLYQIQTHSSALNPAQRTHLSNLIHCFGEYGRSLFAKRFVKEQEDLTVNSHFEYESVKTFYMSMMSQVQLIIEKNRDFLSLPLSERLSLLRISAEHTASMGGMLTVRLHKLFDYVSFYQSAELIFRPESAAVTRRVMSHFDSDETFMKIMLAVVSFCTIQYTAYTADSVVSVVNISNILRIQDMYTDLAWRYLLSKYDHQESVLKFSNFIRCLFLVHAAVVAAHESQQYHQIVDYIIEQSEKAFTT